MFPLRRAIGMAAGLMAGTLGMASVARAHGQPPGIAFWGSFEPGTLACQRTISNSVQRCFEQVLAVDRHCTEDQMAGRPCADETRAAQVTQAKQAAQDAVANACSDVQLQQLRFINLDDAKSDVSRACTDQADAAMSLMYGPMLARGSAAADDAMRSCLQQTAMLSTKLLRVVTRFRSHALDLIAARPGMTPSQKQTLLAQAAARITSLRQTGASLVGQACSTFNAIYGRTADAYLALLEPRGDCVVSSAYVQSAITCPAPVCGNGVKETGEQCDDGNTTAGDLCRNDCTRNDCTVFPSTYALIQSAIFEKHGCTNTLCHGSAQFNQGNLDLRADTSYANLVGVPSAIDPRVNRVEPGDRDRSLLWLKLAAATLGRAGVPGSPMPQNLPPISENELEALRLWIHGGAPQSGTVGGVAEKLDACALPPDPIAIRPLDPPVAGTGVQMHMPRWELPPQSESEVCFVTYYDFTDQVPAQFRGPDGTTFRFKRQELTQDPQSHHLIVNLYSGVASIDDPAWGAFTCKGGALQGQPCDPKNRSACGSDGVCGSEPRRSVACIGFGPFDLQTGMASKGVTGTQQTAFEQAYPEGVYDEFPLRGIIVWNSHAFNLSKEPAKEEGWINLYFAAPQEQHYPVQILFDASAIFVEKVPPFQTREYCRLHVVAQGTRLFQLSSHTHKRGKRFDIFQGSFRCAGGPHDRRVCSPLHEEVCAGAPCRDEGGRDAAQSLLYTNFIYNDPLQLIFDPPMAFDDPDPRKRTFTYCGLYDNGATDPTEVKRQSTSPPIPLPIPIIPGGPCAIPSGCTAGNVGQSCSGSTQAERDAACDTSPGKGDGFCDACTLRGGVTTEDEMFIMLGSYYMQ